MGFYFEMSPQGAANDSRVSGFAETQIPPVFWVLYLIAGFALLCMGLAANHLLATLLKEGTAFDRGIVSLIFFSVPFYLLVGVRFTFVRKFIAFETDSIAFGFRLGNLNLRKRTVRGEAVSSVELMNRRPTSNLAPKRHGDSQYYIRGHWRVGLILRSGKFVTLDRHTEKEALEPIYESLKEWFSACAAAGDSSDGAARAPTS